MSATAVGPRAIEDEEFPFEALSDLAEIESWRKEINRPIYHIHKWWAQRLGTVFRAIVLGCFAPKGSDLLSLFYKPVRLSGAVIFDPFMGSGTTVGESLKLGARAVGRDVNPVAYFLVRNALALHDQGAILETFRAVENDVARRLRRYYETSLPDGTRADVLYFFWVKTLDCVACGRPIDLFSSYIFAQHAYPRQNPEAQALCPHCDAINEVRFDTTAAKCRGCQRIFNPHAAPARGQKVRCPKCEHLFPIAPAIRKGKHPPRHRLYAKLVLLPDGTKAYLPIDEVDRARYDEAARTLADRRESYPVISIQAGYNTNQAIGHNYRHWHEMFNARQLLCLSILADRIKKIGDPAVRDLFTCLFSGTLEFNNMFTSYKGEGTGAVRHMFAHHILKPERMPLEANLWGTPRSSGSFSTLFTSRIQRALSYAQAPFELRADRHHGRRASGKVYGLSDPLGFDIAESFSSFALGKRLYLSCGDSSSTDLPDESVDAVVTDPPFFDNVHYSQLADFFHIWQRHILGCEQHRQLSSTRSTSEVQNSDAAAFTQRLTAVFLEAHRVLKQHGILALTYHHSRPEGWRSILAALMESDFEVTAAQPIKAEMSVSMPKHQAKEPIDLDVILVGRKRSQPQPREWNGDLWQRVVPAAEDHLKRLRAVGRCLSRNDVRVILMAHLVRQLSTSHTTETALSLLDSSAIEIEAHIERMHCAGRAKRD